MFFGQSLDSLCCFSGEIFYALGFIQYDNIWMKPLYDGDIPEDSLVVGDLE